MVFFSLSYNLKKIIQKDFNSGNPYEAGLAINCLSVTKKQFFSKIFLSKKNNNKQILI